jgi:ribosomal protein S18 acetylase RimI-like enzyme
LIRGFKLLRSATIGRSNPSFGFGDNIATPPWKTPAMMQLLPMLESDFEAFKSKVLYDYAADLLKADGGSLDEALARATQIFAKVLPDGQHTPNQYFFTLDETELPVSVGWLWLAKVTSERGNGAYIYSIFVWPQYRGQGFGTCALQAAEEWATKLGIQHIDLNVFGHNVSAQRLYKKMGYEATRISMTRVLS